jgi:cell division septation protein DedD
LQGDGSSSPADVDSRADVNALPSLTTTADDKESGITSPVSSVSPDVTSGEASAARNRLTAKNETGSVQAVDRDNQEAILRAALTTADDKTATTTTPAAEDKPELLTIEKTSLPGSKATTSDTNKESAYRVQLGSYRSEAAANAGIAILRSAHDDILGDLNLGIKAVTLPEIGDYFRVVTAPLPSRVAAAEICRELQSREVNCLVWRRR